VVKIKLKTVLEEIVERHSHGALGKEVKTVLTTGGIVDGVLAVDAMLFKLEQADVVRRGFVLVDFP
jgi:adenylate kinase family enzyme